MAADGVLDPVSEFKDRIGTEHLAIGKVQIRRLRRVLDGESERKGDVGFLRTSVQYGRLESPPAKGLDCGVEKKRITRNGLQVGDGSVDSDDHDEIDYPFSMRESCLSWVNGIYDIQETANKVVLLEVNAWKFRMRRSALRRCLSSEDRQ